MKQFIGVFLLFFFGAQVTLQAQQDSLVFTYDAYLSSILDHHPVAKQADLYDDLADAEWLAARGTLDPKLQADWNQKNFDKKTYYRHFTSKLQVPTPLGIDLVGGYEHIEGDFVNPENITGESGLWNLGVEANLIQGLWINERRTALRQARVFRDMTENQRQILLNELLYKASVAYLNWQEADAIQQVLENNIEVAETYLQNTKISYVNGEKTAVDTLEAFILKQDRVLAAQENYTKVVKARQMIDNYLWLDETPVALTESSVPEQYTRNLFLQPEMQDINGMVTQNPLIQEKVNKQSYLEIEQRWKREKLKPKLKLKYNPLITTDDEVETFNFDNFKFGLDFSIPLFFRAERAAVQQGEIKIRELEYEIDDKQNQLVNKIENNLQQQEVLENQRITQEENLSGYQALLEAENIKFQYGESSVFLLNKRQEKYIDGQVKLIKTIIKQQHVKLEYLYLTNQLIP